METYGIKETKELLDFGFKLQNAIMGALEDKKINVVIDAPKFLPALIAAPKAINGINFVGRELADLDDVERKELSDFIRERFELSDASLEIIIEDTIDQILALAKIATRWAKYRK